MSFLGGSPATPTAGSQTQAIKQQVAQEAAVANARQLVEVIFSLLRPLHLTHALTTAHRNSTSTASNAASPSPAPRSRRANLLATPNAWKSTCRPGTPSRSSTSTGYRERPAPAESCNLSLHRQTKQTDGTLVRYRVFVHYQGYQIVMKLELGSRRGPSRVLLSLRVVFHDNRAAHFLAQRLPLGRRQERREFKARCSVRW